MEKLNIVMMSVPFKLIQRWNPHQNSSSLSVEMYKLIPKSKLKCTELWIAKTILQKKTKFRELELLDFNTC